MENLNNQLSMSFDQVDLVANSLKILSNPDRLKILCVLIEHELHVQNIEEFTDIHQPTLSQQLTVLRKADLVKTRRDGKQIYYQIKDEKILKLMQSLHQLYCHT